MVHPKNKMRNATTNLNTSRIFENKHGVNKNKRNEKATSGKSEISTLKSCHSTKEIQNSNQTIKVQILTEITEMDREIFCHWAPHAKLWRLS